jgi:hypothetical protein
MSGNQQHVHIDSEFNIRVLDEDLLKQSTSLESEAKGFVDKVNELNTLVQGLSTALDGEAK